MRGENADDGRVHRGTHSLLRQPLLLRLLWLRALSLHRPPQAGMRGANPTLLLLVLLVLLQLLGAAA
jgi:hypothetical protein